MVHKISIAVFYYPTTEIDVYHNVEFDDEKYDDVDEFVELYLTQEKHLALYDLDCMVADEGNLPIYEHNKD